ncbi:MAG: DNA replication/repair protein RecF [Clostridia bacterium]|nr:DNA replication/repair protein RecF [Clostridia bacterium]
MYIKSINLKNFRNYENQFIEFSPGKNIIYGLNGQGKTNIIEAIYFFQKGRSYRSQKDKEIINFKKEYAKIEASFEKENSKSDAFIFISDKKSIKVNGIQIDKLSELVGEYSMVIFTPDYLNLIKEGPGVRRNFLDNFISQIKPVYFKNLINYYRVLKQRNNLLKSRNKNIEDTLFLWDEKLSSIGVEICKMRSAAIEKINESVNLINGDNENIEIIKILYSPSIKGDYCDKENFLNQLKNSRERDLEKGITMTGPHRDDFDIFMNDINIKKYGSQGQMRSCVLKIKLSECEIIKEKTGEEPILLLDDILSELDEKRRKFFLDKIKNRQVILTCTDKEDFFEEECKLFHVEKGKIY